VAVKFNGARWWSMEKEKEKKLQQLKLPKKKGVTAMKASQKNNCSNKGCQKNNGRNEGC